jgi:hypothetical protein
MSISPSPSGSRRPQLGSPVVSVIPSGRYLRHRVAVEAAFRARRRAAWRLRTLAAVGAGIFYFAIGRELMQLTRAKTSLFCTVVRRDTRTFSGDIENLAQLGRLRSDPAAVLPEGLAISQQTDPGGPQP